MPFCLPEVIAGEQAADRFSRPRFSNLYGLLAKPVRVASKGDPNSRKPPFVELLWLPAFAVRVRAVSPKAERKLWVSVDGMSGEVSLLECAGDIVERKLREDCFPPTLEEASINEFARKGFMRFVMAQRGQINKPTVEDVEEIKLYYYAVWVYYYRRRRKRIDLKILDAYTGKTSGAKTRVSVVNALVAANRRAEGNSN
jgi:hypothetical protein